MARGAAIEVRLNAESPAAGFRPETGTIAAITPPPGLRFETGVAAGSQVTAFYDSMIAKLIASGADRAEAVRRLQTGIAELAVFGLPTNQLFLRDIAAHPNFIAGHLTTRFLDEAFPGGWRPDAPVRDAECIAASCAWMLRAAEHAPPHLGPMVVPRRLPHSRPRRATRPDHALPYAPANRNGPSPSRAPPVVTASPSTQPHTMPKRLNPAMS